MFRTLRLVRSLLKLSLSVFNTIISIHKKPIVVDLKNEQKGVMISINESSSWNHFFFFFTVNSIFYLTFSYKFVVLYLIFWCSGQLKLWYLVCILHAFSHHISQFTPVCTIFSRKSKKKPAPHLLASLSGLNSNHFIGYHYWLHWLLPNRLTDVNCDLLPLTSTADCSLLPSVGRLILRSWWWNVYAKGRKQRV